MKILTKIHVRARLYPELPRAKYVHASIQWINAVKGTTTGTCYQWMSVNH